MELPAQIGKYEVLGLLGRGGMGAVYKARDHELGRSVALKVMTKELAAEPETQTRFLREARAVSMLQHANIVVVYELGYHDGFPYIAMEFLDGEPLDRIILNGVPLSVLEKTEIILQVAKALKYAHDKGVIHRDIKPGNIMRMCDGTVKVVDFGIAHLADQTITRTGMVLGTLAYLAPEQLNGEGVDRRTDIFSVGVVLYQLLTGRLPFQGASTAETMRKILLEPPPPLSQQSDVDPADLQPLIDKALAKKKDERFQSCSEMAEALARLSKKLEAQIQMAAVEPVRLMPLVQLNRQDGAAVPVALQPGAASAAGQSARVVPSRQAADPDAILATEMVRTPPFRQSKYASVSQIAADEETRPSVRARGNRLKRILVGLAIVVAATSLYLWRTRLSNSASSLPLPPGRSLSLSIRPNNVQMLLTPTAAQVVSGSELDFSVTVSGTNDIELTWSVKEGEVGGRVVTRGTPVTESGLSARAVYIAPKTPGTYHIVVATKADPHTSATAEITVTPRSPLRSPTPAHQPHSDSPFTVH